MNLEGSVDWAQKQKERQKIRRRMEREYAGKFSYKTLFQIIPAAALALLAAAFAIYLYRNYQREAGLEFSGSTITVKRGANFQAALDRAKPGDTILLEAGATFSGAFNLPNKTGDDFITIRTSAPDTQLPPVDTRINPKKYAAVLPKLESNVRGKPVVLAENGAHHFRFVGVEFAPTIEGLYNIIKIGTTEEKSVEELPHHIEFDRVYIHGSPTEGQRRGIAANGRFIKITNSYISDIKQRGEESQAIAIWATDGPVEIVNNYLEAAAENILFGGGGSALKLVPTGCLVRGNYLNKPLNWRDEKWEVKNLFEIKNGRRIRVENNLMTNNWTMAQDGTAILFSTRADNGAATIIEDIEFINNIVRSSANAVSIQGTEGSGGHRLQIRNNFFIDITGEKWGSAGFFMKSTEWDDVTIENNTIIQSGSITNAYGKPITGFVFRNNIIFENEYGIKGDSTASGQSSINKYFPNSGVSYNAIIGGTSALYRQKNFFPESIGQVGFVNAEKGDYRLRSDSPYLNKGFGGKRIGADLDAKLIGGK